MTTPNDLTALAARMQEAQAEEQYYLLWDAFRLLELWDTHDERYFEAMLDAEGFESAALMLVPAGWVWMTGCAAGEGFFATLSPTDESGIDADAIDTNAQTPALAIASTALLAHVEMSK